MIPRARRAIRSATFKGKNEQHTKTHLTLRSREKVQNLHTKSIFHQSKNANVCAMFNIQALLEDEVIGRETSKRNCDNLLLLPLAHSHEFFSLGSAEGHGKTTRSECVEPKQVCACVCMCVNVCECVHRLHMSVCRVYRCVWTFVHSRVCR